MTDRSVEEAYDTLYEPEGASWTSGTSVQRLMEMIEEHPVGASLAALGLGAVAALILMPHKRDRYAKLERRLEKAMRAFVKVKQEVDEELDELRELAEERAHLEKQHGKAEKRLEELEEELAAREDEADEADEEDEADEAGAAKGRSAWKALLFSTLGSQLMHLLMRWVSRKVVTDRQGDRAELYPDDVVGYDEPAHSEYIYTPPI